MKFYERVIPNVAGTLDDFPSDKFPIDELIISGDLVFASVTFNTIFSSRSSTKAYTIHSRHYYILQKRHDGNWKITHDIWNNIPYNIYFNFSKIRTGNDYCLKGDYTTARANYKRIHDVATDGKLKMRSLFWQAVTYIYENNITEALKLYNEYQSIAEQDRQLSNYRIWAYANFGNIHTELGDPAEGLKYYKKAIDLVDKVELGKSEKETIIFDSIQWQANALIALGELDKAKEILQKYEQQAAAKEDETKEKTLNIVRARLAMAEGNADAALELLSNADASDPMTAYYQAVIYKKKGDTEKASELYRKIEEWADNGINLALVRNKMSNKL